MVDGLRIIPQFKNLTVISHRDLADFLGIEIERLFLEFDYTPGNVHKPSLGRFHVLLDGAELSRADRDRVADFLRKKLKLNAQGDA